MSQGTEASARAIEDVIARAVRELDLEDGGVADRRRGSFLRTARPSDYVR